MMDRLIRITTALAALMVASVAAIISYQRLRTRLDARRDGLHRPPAALYGGRADLGRIDGGPGCEPPELPGAAPGAVQPGRWHRGHHRRQPGARPGPRAGRRAGQRLATPGAGRLVRALDAPIRRHHQAGADDELEAGCLADGSAVSHAGTALARVESPFAQPAPALEQQVRDLHR